MKTWSIWAFRRVLVWWYVKSALASIAFLTILLPLCAGAVLYAVFRQTAEWLDHAAYAPWRVLPEWRKAVKWARANGRIRELSSGERVIDARDMDRFFDPPPEGGEG